MAAPLFVAGRASESTDFSGSRDTLSTPSGVTSQHTLVAVLSIANGNVFDFDAPSSEWTLVGRSTTQSSCPRYAVWVRKPNGVTPSSSYSFEKDYNSYSAGIIAAFSGVDPENPIAVSLDTDADTGSSDTATATSLTTPTNDCLLINIWAATPYASGSTDDQYSSSITGGSDGTVKTETTDYQSLLMSWDEIATAGSTGTRTATFNDTSSSAGPAQVYGSFALAPIAAGAADQTVNVGVVIEFESAQPVDAFLEGDEPVPEVRTTPITLAERIEMLEASSVAFRLSKVEVLSETDEIEVDDISDLIHGCTVEHGGFRNIHRIATLEMTTELDWGRQRVKPYLTVEGGGWSDTLPLGVFCMTAPTLLGGFRPPRFSVQGYDKMYLVDQTIAAPISFPIDQPVLGAVRELLGVRGMQVDRIDTSRATDVLTEVRAWAVEQGTTYLTVINDLLAMVGYRQLRIDRDGFPESGPHAPASQRQVMWRYDAGNPGTTVHQGGREHVDDFTDRPNRWVFWRNGTEEELPPVEGDGLYIVDNLTQGRSSQNSRGGLVITRAESIEALTQADLEANGNRIVAEDMESSTTVRLTTDLNPYHDHQDIVELIDRDIGVAAPFESMVWGMDVFTRLMTHEMRSIPGGIT